MRVLLFLLLLIPSLSWGGCEDDLKYEWTKDSVNNSFFQFINKTNREIKITEIILLGSTKNTLKTFRPNTTVNGKKNSKTHVSYASTSIGNKAKFFTFKCKYTNNANNIVFENFQILFSIGVLAFIGFLVIIIKSHQKKRKQNFTQNKTSNVQIEKAPIQHKKNDKVFIFTILVIIIFLIYFFTIGKNTKFGWKLLEAGLGGFFGAIPFGVLFGVVILIRKFYLKKKTNTPKPVEKKEMEKTTIKNPEFNDVDSQQLKSIKSNNNDEDIYEQIANELESNKRIGLWTKAIAEADGDENKAKAIYIKLRFEQIKNS